MPDPFPLWHLEGFEEQFADWVSRESPDPEVQAAVAEWIPTRKLDPLRDVREEKQVEGLLWRRVPHTSDGRQVVICAYFLDHAERTVTCVQIAWAPADV